MHVRDATTNQGLTNHVPPLASSDHRVLREFSPSMQAPMLCNRVQPLMDYPAESGTPPGSTAGTYAANPSCLGSADPY